MSRFYTVVLLLALPAVAASLVGANYLLHPDETPQAPVVPARNTGPAVAAPQPGHAHVPAAPPAPWANKFFLADIAKNPTQAIPPVIVHDFGTVPHGTLCVKRFTVTNVYDVPMQVVDIRRSCGCLMAYPPEKVLQPNEAAEFTVTMDTAKFSGPNAQTIYVTFGPQYVSTAVLRIQGNSRTDVTLSPGTVHFGTVAQGAKPAQTVVLEYTGRQRDWKVTGVVPSAAPLDVQVRPVSSLGAWLGTKYAVTVTLKPDAPAGPLSEVVSLKTNDPSAPVVQVNVTGVVQAPLTLSTDKVQFARLRVGESAVFKVIVRAENPFRVQPVADDGDGVSVEAFPAANPIQIVTVKFAPSKPGVVRKEVRLQTTLNGGATATIFVEGEAEPAGP